MCFTSFTDLLDLLFVTYGYASMVSFDFESKMAGNAAAPTPANPLQVTYATCTKVWYIFGILAQWTNVQSRWQDNIVLFNIQSLHYFISSNIFNISIQLRIVSLWVFPIWIVIQFQCIQCRINNLVYHLALNLTLYYH